MKNKKNKWEHTRDYFVDQNMYTEITRKDYLIAMRAKGLWPLTCDHNRCILMTAGYLIRRKLGVYVKVKSISWSLTYKQARIKAYGSYRGRI